MEIFSNSNGYFAHLEICLVKLSVLDVLLVDDLRDADDLSVVVADGHADQAAGAVASLRVVLGVEARVLQRRKEDAVLGRDL